MISRNIEMINRVIWHTLYSHMYSRFLEKNLEKMWLPYLIISSGTFQCEKSAYLFTNYCLISKISMALDREKGARKGITN